jgi:nicotinamidase-related amidase
MKVLIVIDMQHDFVDGVLGSPEARAIVPAIAAKVAEYAAMEEGVILYTRDTHFDNYMETMEGKYLPVPHCIANSEGWQIVPEVFNDDSEVVDKYTFGCYSLPDEIWSACGLKYSKFDIDSIEFCGVCTDICVVSNVMITKTVFHQTPIIVDSKCCAGVTPAKHEAALETMRSCQIEVI